MNGRIEQIGDCCGVPVTFVGDRAVVTIYGIRGARDGPLVYVGSTAQLLKDRIRAHVLAGKNGSDLPVHKWMREHQSGFVVEVLEHTDASRREDRERFWVFSNSGLLNLTDGGRGMSGHKFAGSEHADRIAKALRSGRVFDCLQCGDSFWRKPRDIRMGNNKFCSRGCYQTWQRGRPKVRAM